MFQNGTNLKKKNKREKIPQDLLEKLEELKNDKKRT